MTTNPTTQPHDYDPKILADPEYNRSYHAYLTTNPPEEAARLAYAWTARPRAAVDPRTAALDATVTDSINAGWAVESQSQTRVVFTSGEKPNHVVHAILTVFTVGLWVPIWFIAMALSSRKRIVATVNEDGAVSWSQAVNY